MKRFQSIASTVDARLNCIKANNSEWLNRLTETIEGDVDATAPSGSGFDNGTNIDLDASTADKLVFTTAFHHMNDGGYYDGWTEHTVTVRPSLAFGFNLSVSGRNRNDIKDYINEVFHNWLNEDVNS